MKEPTEVKVKTPAGVEIKIPRLTKLEELSIWLHRLGQAIVLLRQHFSEEDAMATLNPRGLISDEAKVQISAVVLYGEDANEVDADVLMEALRAYSDEKSETTNSSSFTVVLDRYRDLLGKNTWSYESAIYKKRYCRDWMENTWAVLYSVIHECQYKPASDDEITRLFIGGLEPAEFRQYLTVRIKEAIKKGEMIPTARGLVPLAWNAPFVIMRFCVEIAKEIDEQSKRDANYFSSLGHSKECKVEMHHLDPYIKTFTKSVAYDPDSSGWKGNNSKLNGKKSGGHHETPKTFGGKDKRRGNEEDSNPKSGKRQKPNTGKGDKPTGKDKPKAEVKPIEKNPNPLPCVLCAKPGHKARECPRGKCWNGCSEVPSKKHDAGGGEIE